MSSSPSPTSTSTPSGEDPLASSTSRSRKPLGARRESQQQQQQQQQVAGLVPSRSQSVTTTTYYHQQQPSSTATTVDSHQIINMSEVLSSSSSSQHHTNANNNNKTLQLFNVDTQNLQNLIEQLVQGHNAQVHQINTLQNEVSSLRAMTNRNRDDSTNAVQALTSKQEYQFKYLRTILGDDLDETAPLAPGGGSTSLTFSGSSSPTGLISPVSRNSPTQPTKDESNSFSGSSSRKPSSTPPPANQQQPKTQPKQSTGALMSSSSRQAPALPIHHTEGLVPYQNLPHVFRSSFDFIRKDFKQQLERQSEKLSKQIEESIAKAVKEVLESANSKVKTSAEDLREAIEQKTTSLSKQVNDRLSDLMQNLARGFEKSENAENTLRTNLQSVTTLTQRLEKRFTERLNQGDERASSMESAFSNHLVQFSDLTHRITPLIGGEEMDEAVVGMTKSGFFSSSASNHQHHHHQKQRTTATTFVPPSTQTQQDEEEDESTQQHQQSLMRLSSRRKSVAPVMLCEDELEKSLEETPPRGENYSTNHHHSTSSPPTTMSMNRSQSQQQNQQNQNQIASSLVGSIDVEVLASHDARAIAMLHTAPFVALRHQVLQDTKMRVAATRDSIMAELDSHLQELRDDINRRPMPQRVVEMIRDMTSDKQVPEQLAEIRQHLQSLENGKIGHRLFNEALKQKSDLSIIQGKAERDDVNAQMQNVNAKLEFLKEDLTSVQTERSQFRNMLREVLYMHRRAQAISGGGGEAATHNSPNYSMQFVNQSEGTIDQSRRFTSTNNGASSSSAQRPSSVQGIHAQAQDMERSLLVRDPKLPFVQDKDAYEVLDDDPRMKIPNSGSHHHHSVENNKRNSYRPPPTAPSGSSSPRSLRRNPSSSARRPAQKMVEDILLSSNSNDHQSPKKTGSMRRQQQQQSSPHSVSSSSRRRSAAANNSNENSGSLPNLSSVGSRDMTQKYRRKVYTPTDERADPPMD